MTEHQHHAERHGHAHDRGFVSMARYLSMLPHLWRSPVSDAVVALVQPRPGERAVITVLDGAAETLPLESATRA